MALSMKLCVSSLTKISQHKETKLLQCLIQHSNLRLLQHNKNFFCSKPDESNQQFDETLLQVLVCPLSKKPLRYDKKNSELVSDSIGVAYQIKNGIPNLVPQDARMLETPDKENK